MLLVMILLSAVIELADSRLAWVALTLLFMHATEVSAIGAAFGKPPMGGRKPVEGEPDGEGLNRRLIAAG